MFAQQASHFKHGDLFFAAKNGLEQGIGVDVALVGRILQIVLFDVTQICLTTSVRGKGFAPTTFAKSALGVSAFMKAALGLRFAAAALGAAAFFAGAFAGAAFTAAFFAGAFFAVAISGVSFV